MGAFRRESEDEDIVFICNFPEIISFMRIMAINKEENAGIIDLVCTSKWDECFLKPFEAKFIVSLSIGGYANCTNWNIQIGKCWDGPLGQDECRWN